MNLWSLIEPAESQDVLNFWTGSDAYYYVCGTLSDFGKPAELKDLLGSCGADDVYYYACGALNDSNKNLRSSKIY